MADIVMLLFSAADWGYGMCKLAALPCPSDSLLRCDGDLRVQYVHGLETLPQSAVPAYIRTRGSRKYNYATWADTTSTTELRYGKQAATFHSEIHALPPRYSCYREGRPYCTKTPASQVCRCEKTLITFDKMVAFLTLEPVASW